MRALEEMGWLPEFVTGRVWRCAKWATSQAVARPYAGLEELRRFARACDGKAQWTAYGLAALSFTCLLRVGEAAPIRRGGSRARGLGFHTDPHFVRRKLGSYGRAWLRWLDREGSTSAVPLAHFCPQGAAYLQMVMATALSGCASARARWHVWRRGGSAALRWLGIPIRWLALCGRWMLESVAAHYGDAPDDFIVADNVELPWPGARGGMEWEWRFVSLKDMFSGELLAPAMGIVTQWAIRLQTSDFYGPSPPTPSTQAPHDRPPPPNIRLVDTWKMGKYGTSENVPHGGKHSTPPPACFES